MTYITGNTYPVKDKLRSIGCRWDATRKQWGAPSEEIAAKAREIVSPHPAYNSPPPADLGTTDPEELARRHGRTAVAGAKVQSFTRYGLPRGQDGTPDGAIHLIRGKRYVQVARTPRRYLSREWLEDMDLFNAEPGGAYQWDGVEVVATPEECAEDSARKAAKDAPIIARKLWEAVVAKISEQAAGAPEWVTPERRVARWYRPAMVHTASHPEIYVSDSHAYYYVPGYFACDWDTPPVHRVTAITDELRSEIDAAVKACREAGLLDS